MSRHDLEDRLLEYGANVVRVVGILPRNVVGHRIGDQLLRSGTAVGANYAEARAAESTADFAHKLQIALKELRESHFWLRLLARVEVLPPDHLAPLINESTQLRAILSKAVATTKGKAK